MGNAQIIQWVDSHGILVLAVFIFTNTCVGYLPAPTKDSAAFYVWFFKVSNSLVMSFARAFGSRVENSPNFQDAVKVVVNGGTGNPALTAAIEKARKG